MSNSNINLTKECFGTGLVPKFQLYRGGCDTLRRLVKASGNSMWILQVRWRARDKALKRALESRLSRDPGVLAFASLRLPGWSGLGALLKKREQAEACVAAATASRDEQNMLIARCYPCPPRPKLPQNSLLARNISG